MAFSPDLKRLAAGDPNGNLTVLDIDPGGRVLSRSTVPTHQRQITQVAFTRDGKRLVTAGHDGTVKMWDTDQMRTSGRLTRSLFTLPRHSILSVTFSPFGTRLATMSRDGAQVWDAATGSELVRLQGSSAHGQINAIAFSSDGMRLATAGSDGAANVSDARSGTRIASPVHLATASTDGTIRIYSLDIKDLLQLARQRAPRSLTPAECRKYLGMQCPKNWVIHGAP